MTDFSKKSQTIEYFNSIVDDLQQWKIKSIFSFSPMGWSNYRGYRTYSTETEIYILLDNDYCLVIDYLFVDELNVQFRKLTSLEKEEHHRIFEKDFFNSVDYIREVRGNNEFRWKKTCNLEYGSIVNVSIRSVTENYGKWFKDGIDYVSPAEETFDEIKFTMSNGKSFFICADDANMDGWALFWSEDTDETTTEIDKEIK